MSKWLSACALALLLATPALAQSNEPDRVSRPQPQATDTAKPSGDFTPSGEAEAKTSRQPAGSTTPRSGASGVARPADRAVGATKPADDSTEAYKKDFEKK